MGEIGAAALLLLAFSGIKLLYLGWRSRRDSVV
jgi:hypothetical protein